MMGLQAQITKIQSYQISKIFVIIYFMSVNPIKVAFGGANLRLISIL